jgi:thiamine biosynthesis protein ThiS
MPAQAGIQRPWVPAFAGTSGTGDRRSEQRRMRPMRLTINGETRNFREPMNVVGLIGALELEPKKIAVERNREIVPKSQWEATALADGDRIEIVQFVGGG